MGSPCFHSLMDFPCFHSLMGFPCFHSLKDFPCFHSLMDFPCFHSLMVFPLVLVSIELVVQQNAQDFLHLNLNHLHLVDFVQYMCLSIVYLCMHLSMN